MTGEITLRGEITPVGGIKEKVNSGYWSSHLGISKMLLTQYNDAYFLQLLGAHRSGIKTVVLPFKNRKDVVGKDAGLPLRVLEEIEIVYVRTLIQALEVILGVLHRTETSSKNCVARL